MKKFGIGIIGLGYWGKKYFETLCQISECDLYLCDVDDNALRSINFKRYVDYEMILRNPDINAVIIATPDSTHYQLSRQALLNGKDVLVEKPMSLTLRHAEELVNLAQKMNRILAVAHTPLFSAGYRQLKNKLQSGKLSPVIQLQAIRTSRGRVKASNPLWDLASHDIAIGISLFGKPKKTICKINTPQTCQYEILFNNGMTFIGEAQWSEPPYLRRLRLITKNCSYEYDEPIGVAKCDGPPPLTLMIHEFINCCTLRREPINNGNLGKQVVQCLENLTEYKIMNYEIVGNHTCL